MWKEEVRDYYRERILHNQRRLGNDLLLPFNNIFHLEDSPDYIKCYNSEYDLYDKNQMKLGKVIIKNLNQEKELK